MLELSLLHYEMFEQRSITIDDGHKERNYPVPEGRFRTQLQPYTMMGLLYLAYGEGLPADGMTLYIAALGLPSPRHDGLVLSSWLAPMDGYARAKDFEFNRAGAHYSLPRPQVITVATKGGEINLAASTYTINI
jgi:hypothetical protein